MSPSHLTTDHDACGVGLVAHVSGVASREIVDRALEALVRLVASTCGIEEDLGEQEKRGILQSMQTRAAFLSDVSHRIRFMYTPKHTSWLNQIALWFSILVRRLLKRGNFTSVEDLRERILAFIAYFNLLGQIPRSLLRLFPGCYCRLHERLST